MQTNSIFSTTIAGEGVIGFTCSARHGTYLVRIRLTHSKTVELTGAQAEAFIRQVAHAGKVTFPGAHPTWQERQPKP